MKRHQLITIGIVALTLLVSGCAPKAGRPAARVEQPQATSGVVAVEGAELHYVIEGEGIPCMVIGSATYHLRTFSQELRKRLRLIFMDTRGFVPSDTTIDIDKYTMDTMLDEVEQVRRALGLEKIAVLGHSMFALVVLEYAKKYPDRVSHVIMIAMSPHFNAETFQAADEYWESHASEERKALLGQNLEALNENELAKLSPGEAFIIRYNASGPQRWYDPTYDGSWLWKGVELNGDLVNHFLGVVLSEYDIEQGLDRVTMPVFLAVGRHDYGIPYYLWDDFRKGFSNLSFNLFEKSGHHPMLEEQALFDSLLIDWIEGE